MATKEEIQEMFERLTERFNIVNARFDRLDERLNDMDKKTELRMDDMKQQILTATQHVTTLENKVNTNQETLRDEFNA